MALVECSECKKEISDKATTCPNCGNPMSVKEVITAPKSKEKKVEYHRKSWILGGGEWTQEELDTHHAEQEDLAKSSWYHMKFFWLSKQSGFIGQIIIGFIIAAILHMMFTPQETTGRLFVYVAASLPWLYLNKYSGKTNKLLVYATFIFFCAGFFISFYSNFK